MIKTTNQSLHKTFGSYKMDRDLFCTAVTEISGVITTTDHWFGWKETISMSHPISF